MLRVTVPCTSVIIHDGGQLATLSQNTSWARRDVRNLKGSFILILKALSNKALKIEARF